MSERKVSTQALREIEAALEEYKNEVNGTNLAQSSKETYLDHADAFVRWLKGEFEPGSRV